MLEVVLGSALGSLSRRQHHNRHCPGDNLSHVPQERGHVERLPLRLRRHRHHAPRPRFGALRNTRNRLTVAPAPLAYRTLTRPLSAFQAYPPAFST